MSHSPKDLRQAEFFGNRLQKRKKQLSKWARSLGIDCYRLFDNDIPEVPLAVDAYADALLLALYERPYEKDPAEEEAWLGLMRDTAAERLGIEPKRVFHKLRRRQKGESQYERLSSAGVEFAVREQGLSFLVNLSDYLDTGLFLDHRPTRAMLRERAAGKSVLNLFSYTGSFSVYAAAGGARRLASVDMSNTYAEWEARNFALNGLGDFPRQAVRADALAWLEEAARAKETWDIIVLDPPTFSNSKKMRGDFDLNEAWPRLLAQCIAILSPDGHIIFSTNSRRLRMDPSLVPGASIADISEKTLPPDFRDRRIHRAWEIRRA
jgi:23S rRNA G2069 N7-methylase RlmK/C1962 C5-methylase RlmI